MDCVLGVVYCILIITIPVGRECFKIAHMAIWPFGRKVVCTNPENLRDGFNAVWIIFGGEIEGIIWFVVSIVMFCTIILIPFGMQAWKMMKITLFPFGRTIVNFAKQRKEEKLREKYGAPSPRLNPAGKPQQISSGGYQEYDEWDGSDFD